MTKALRAGDYRLMQDAPVEEPVSLAAAKTHLRLTGSADDETVAQCVAAARTLCEEYTGRAFTSRTAKIMLDRWPVRRDENWWDGVREGAAVADVSFSLPLLPMQSMDGIDVYDAQGLAVTVDPSCYIADLNAARIAFREVPPEPGIAFNGIAIRFTAGYGAASAVPAPLRQAVMQLSAYLYSNRGDEPSAESLRGSGAMALLAPYRGVGLR